MINTDERQRHAAAPLPYHREAVVHKLTDRADALAACESFSAREAAHAIRPHINDADPLGSLTLVLNEIRRVAPASVLEAVAIEDAIDDARRVGRRAALVRARRAAQCADGSV